MKDPQYLAEAAMEAFELAQEQTGEQKTHTLLEGNLLATLALHQSTATQVGRDHG